MKAVLDTLDGIDESLHTEYEQKDGKFFLKIDGEIPGMVAAATHEEVKRSLSEFRDTNIGLKQKADDLSSRLDRYKDLDPEKYQAAVDELAELKKKAPQKDQALAKVQEQLDSLSRKLDETSEREKAARRDLAQKDLESTLRDLGVKAGVDDKAMPDFLSRATRVFKVADDLSVTTEVYSQDNPGKKIDPTEWVGTLRPDAPHLFKPSKGGGASGTPGAPGTARSISDDPYEIGKNLEDLASGKARIAEQVQ